MDQGPHLRFPIEDFFHELDELLAEDKIRYVSLTNGNLELLKKYHEKFGNKLFSHEIAYNFEIRINEELGIIPYALEHGIKPVSYQPLRKNKTAERNWPVIVEMAEKYNATQNQIILNWQVSKGILPIFKSESVDHIDENLGALTFQMSKEDLEKIQNFKLNWDRPEIDWEKTGRGKRITVFSDIFDDRYYG
jgi:diketogulonate reductase-like aldo/keto reductase